MSSSLEADIMELEKVQEWDSLAANGLGGTVFHESWYLKSMDVGKILCIYTDGHLIAGMPLHGSLELGILFQSTISVPYSGPVLLDGALIKSRHGMVVGRSILEAMIALLKKSFKSISFSASTEIFDIVPYIQNGFVPEVRYTYINHLSRGMENVLEQLSSGRKKDLNASFDKGVRIYYDNDLEKFDIKRALFWADKGGVEEKVRRIIREAVNLNRGKAIVAVDETGRSTGGLFLTWDLKRSYTIYSYFDRKISSYGVPTRLYIEAMRFTKEILGLDFMDFEGSVLPGVEKYYQSFGAVQTLYFNLHWDIDRKKLLGIDFYNYE